ncbi:MAG TPA: hypothetical protein VN922_07420 [Bacteroidia bacterium]|nr:hypothetical protein [Bacteroidia bacterium]
MSERSLNPVNMPVGLGKSVRFANADEIKFALGIPEMDNPVPAGIIENGDGSSIPVFLIEGDAVMLDVAGPVSMTGLLNTMTGGALTATTKMGHCFMPLHNTHIPYSNCLPHLFHTH